MEVVGNCNLEVRGDLEADPRLGVSSPQHWRVLGPSDLTGCTCWDGWTLK